MIMVDYVRLLINVAITKLDKMYILLLFRLKQKL